MPLELDIDNTNKAKEKLIGGPCEIRYLKNSKDNICLLCNKNSRVYNYKPNRYIDDNFIYGNFLIIQNEYETGDFKSLTKKQINKYQKIFGQESIDKTNSRYIAKKLATALFRRR